MKIICIEDQLSKLNSIVSFLNKQGFFSVTQAINYQRGMSELSTDIYDLLLLDMSMPIANYEYRFDTFNSFAGLAVLREIKRKKIDIKVVIITGFNDFVTDNESTTVSFDKLKKQIEKDFNDICIGYILYSAVSVEWQSKLLKIMGEMKK